MYKVSTSVQLSQFTKKLGNKSTIYHQVLTGSGWVALGKFTLALLNIAASSLTAWLLTPSQAGEFVLYTSFIAILVTIASLGFPRTLVRFIAQKPEQIKQITQFSFLLCAITSIVITELCYTFFIYFPQFRPEFLHSVSKTYIILIIIFTTFINLSEEYFRGRQNFQLTAFVDVVFRFFFVSFLLTILLVNGSGLLSSIIEKYTFSAAIAAVGWFSFIYYSVTKSSTTINGGWNILWSYFSISIVVWLDQCFLIILEQAHYWVLGSMTNAENVALYGHAFRLVILVQSPLGLVNAVLSPLIAKHYAQGRIKELEKTLRTITTLIGIPSLLFLLSFILLRENILSMLYGQFYVSASTVIIFLGAGQIVNLWSGSCGLTLVMCGYPKYALIANTISGLLSIFLTYFLIMDYGVIGVAFANFVGVSLQNLLFLLFVRHKVGIWTHFDLSTLFGLKNKLFNLSNI